MVPIVYKLNNMFISLVPSVCCSCPHHMQYESVLLVFISLEYSLLSRFQYENGSLDRHCPPCDCKIAQARLLRRQMAISAKERAPTPNTASGDRQPSRNPDMAGDRKNMEIPTRYSDKLRMNVLMYVLLYLLLCCCAAVLLGLSLIHI